MNPRLLAAAALLLLGLPLLGYFWPLPAGDAPRSDDERWEWPQAMAQSPIASNQRLTRFWPGKAPATTADDATGASTSTRTAYGAWQLIGIVRQGDTFSALVLDPDREVVTLAAGDGFDATRSVTALDATHLHWRDDDGSTGSLTLYPEPDITAPAAAAGAQPEPHQP